MQWKVKKEIPQWQMDLGDLRNGDPNYCKQHGQIADHEGRILQIPRITR